MLDILKLQRKGLMYTMSEKEIQKNILGEIYVACIKMEIEHHEEIREKRRLGQDYFEEMIYAEKFFSMFRNKILEFMEKYELE